MGPHDASNFLIDLSKTLDRAVSALTAPSVLYRPKISMSGDQWRALLGDTSTVGVVGFGKTPAEALAAFDKAFRAQTSVKKPREDAPEPPPPPPRRGITQAGEMSSIFSPTDSGTERR